MHQRLDIGPHVWNNIAGHVVLEISDMPPADGIAEIKTVRQLKESAEKLGGHLIDPISRRPYTLDLNHLSDDTQLYMSWMHIADQTKELADRRHPQNYSGSLEDLIV